jgi:ketosteroid isomerase-like protein
MSQENVEVVRAVYKKWSRGDFRAGVDILDPNLLFILGEEFPESGVYLGHEGLGEYMREFLSAWTKLTIAAEELIPVGDSVIAAVHQQGVGKASGAPAELRYDQVWTFRGKTVIRLEGFWTRPAALEAVGLRE